MTLYTVKARKDKTILEVDHPTMADADVCRRWLTDEGWLVEEPKIVRRPGAEGRFDELIALYITPREKTAA